MKLSRFALSAFCLGVPTFVSVTDVRADDVAGPTRTATLVYVAPANKQCPDDSSFRNRVGARLGADPFVAQSSTSLVVRIQTRADKLVGNVELHQPGATPRTREIATTEGCESLVSALAATVALVLDPTGEAARAAKSATKPETTSEPLSPTAPPSQPPSQSPIAPSAPDPRAIEGPKTGRAESPSPRIVPLVVFGASPAVGLAPAATVGAELGVGLKRGSLALLLQGRIDTMPSTVTLGATANVDLTLFGLGLLPCGLAGHFRICGVVRAGFAQGHASGTNQPAPQASAFTVVGVRPGLLLPIGSFVALAAEVELGAAVARTQLLISQRDVWTAPPVYGSGIFGAVVSFGDGS